jgi:hypothetical protein
VSQLFFPFDGADVTNQPSWYLKAKLDRQTQRTRARKLGVCQSCLKRPAVIQRKTCRDCLIKRNIHEAFKFDRARKLENITQLRGTCYVDQFRPAVRREWVNQIKNKWTGYCYYSGLPIEIGSTAGLDHMLPVSRAAAFGPAKVYHPDNLAWVDKRINRLKGDMTADEFYVWLRVDFPAAIATVCESNLTNC